MRKSFLTALTFTFCFAFTLISHVNGDFGDRFRRTPRNHAHAAPQSNAKSRNPFTRMGNSITNFRERRLAAHASRVATRAGSPAKMQASIAVPERKFDTEINDVIADNGVILKLRLRLPYPIPPLAGSSLTLLVAWSERYPSIDKADRRTLGHCRRRYSERYQRRFFKPQAKELAQAVRTCDPADISQFLWSLVKTHKVTEAEVLREATQAYADRLIQLNAKIARKNATTQSYLDRQLAANSHLSR